MITRKYLIAGITFVFSSIGSFGQDLDSKGKPYSKDIARWDSLYYSTFRFVDKNNQIALCYIDSANEIVNNLGDSLRIVKSHRVRGQILLRLDRTVDAIAEYHSVLDIAKRNHFETETGYALNGLAIAYRGQANYAASLQLHIECLILREREGDCEGICTTLLNIGGVYYKLGNSEKAIEYSLRSLSLAKEIGYTIDRDRLLINIGISYGSLGYYSESTRYINEGFRFCGSNCSEKIKAEGYFGFGMNFFYKSELDSAEFYFLKSYTLAEKISDRLFEVDNLTQLAEKTVKESVTLSKIHDKIQKNYSLGLMTYGHMRLKGYRSVQPGIYFGVGLWLGDDTRLVYSMGGDVSFIAFDQRCALHFGYILGNTKRLNSKYKTDVEYQESITEPQMETHREGGLLLGISINFNQKVKFK